VEFVTLDNIHMLLLAGRVEAESITVTQCL